MEIKDLACDAVALNDVRGGNAIRQSSSNGYVASALAVPARTFNLSPVDVKSEVGQLNVTDQAAGILDSYSSHSRVSIDLSTLDFGFGRLAR